MPEEDNSYNYREHTETWKFSNLRAEICGSNYTSKCSGNTGSLRSLEPAPFTVFNLSLSLLRSSRPQPAEHGTLITSDQHDACSTNVNRSILHPQRDFCRINHALNLITTVKLIYSSNVTIEFVPFILRKLNTYSQNKSLPYIPIYFKVKFRLPGVSKLINKHLRKQRH